MPTLDAPTTFVANAGAHNWGRADKAKPDETKPPDRFAPIPGHNNYRGGAIYSYDQLKMMRDTYGIQTIINLSADSMKNQKSGEFDCSYTSRRSSLDQNCEPQWAQALGMNYVMVPMTVRWRMTDAKWGLIRDALAEGNAYVHCKAGVDRTGGVVARWRLEIDPNLTPAEVMQYTRKFGGYWTYKPVGCQFPSTKNPNPEIVCVPTKRDGSEWEKTTDAAVGKWVVKGKYDPELAARALRPRKGKGLGLIIPALLLGGVWIFRGRRRMV
jgi:hypothetical protein